MSRDMKKKVVFLPYDFDTAIGINNEGSLVFSYNLEEIDQTSGGADIRHYVVTGKICPNLYVKNNMLRTSWTWDEFKSRLAECRKSSGYSGEANDGIEFRRTCPIPSITTGISSLIA